MRNAREVYVYKKKTSFSIIVPYSFLLSRPGNPLRQVFLFELEAYRVIPWVREIGKPIRHAHYEQHDGIASNRHAGSTFFNFDQCRPTYGRARCGDFRRNPPPPPRVTYIVAELAQGARDGNGEPLW